MIYLNKKKSCLLTDLVSSFSLVLDFVSFEELRNREKTLSEIK